MSGSRKHSNTKIFYRGPSVMDSSESVCGIIQLYASSTDKTRNMAQVWVFPEEIIDYTILYLAGEVDKTPTTWMLESGRDKVTCLDCELRSEAAGGDGKCYTHQRTLRSGANQMLYALARHGWPEIGPNRLRQEMLILHQENRKVRNTAFGEAMCLPDAILDILVLIPGTAYTNAWDLLEPNRARKWQKFFMASVHNYDQQARARELGWRCYKRIPVGGPFNREHEFRCPASHEMGHKSTCERCEGCNGWRSDYTKDVVIEDHSYVVVLERARIANVKRRELIKELAVTCS